MSPTARSEQPLEGDAVRRHLVERGLVAESTPVRVEQLGGGVSSELVRASGRGFDFVVKRSLPRLRVELEWLADPRRILNEANALQVAARLLPERVPPVVDVDDETLTIVLEHAPSTWTNWRDELLAGRVDPAVGARLGLALRAWHAGTAGVRASAAESFAEEVFVDLRIDPFFRTVAGLHSNVAARIMETADALLGRRSCLVHGDFSPKNVLTGGGQFWVLDWEVAHLGNPVFDVAYLLTHLGIKSVHLVEHSSGYEKVAQEFLRAYQAAGPADVVDTEELVTTLACLLLARVDGKSRADYLTPSGRQAVRRLALGMLQQPPGHPLELWDRIAAATRSGTS